MAGNADYGDANFQRYYAQIPEFASAWNETVAQFKAEGNIESLPLAADTWVKTFVQIGQANPTLATNIPALVSTTQQFITTSQTVAGAVQTVSGLLNAEKGAQGDYEAAHAAIMAINAVVGTAVTIAAATAPATFGVGALFAAAIAITFELLDLFGAFGKPTPVPAATVCGLNVGIKPLLVIGCMFCAETTQKLIAVSPGANGWRLFPDSASPWFTVQAAPATVITGHPFVSFSWNGLPWAGAVKSLGNNRFTRPIDSAFPQFAWLERPVSASPFGPFANPTSRQFRDAFFVAWKGAMANAFNLAPVLDDAHVLFTVLQYWNKAHSSSSHVDVVADDLFADPSNTSSKPTFAIDNYGTYDPTGQGSTPGYLGAGKIRINTGPLLNPPQTAGAVKVAVLRLRSTAVAAPTPVAAKVAAGVAVAAGSGVLVGIGYSLALGKAWDWAFDQAWSEVKSMIRSSGTRNRKRRR